MSRRSRLLDAAVWAAIGTGVAVASWRMDRLEDRGINPWSVPGLTPGVVGVLMVVLAVVLAASRGPGRADAAEPVAAEGGGVEGGSKEASAARAGRGPGGTARTLLAIVLCVGFAGLALGRGLPFVVEAAAFIFVFTALFSLPAWRVEGRVARGLAQTLAIAVAASVFIAWLFESVFLVRLP